MKKVTGIIEQINFKAMPQPDQFENNFRRSMKVGGEWFSFGACKSDKWNIKVGTGFKELGVGSEVFFLATEREYNGKTYYDAKPSNLTVIEFVEPTAASRAPAQPAQRSAAPAPSAAPASYAKKDDSGIEAGNALTVALLWSKNKLNADIVPLACDILEEGRKLKAVYKKLNPSHTDYEIGAACGQAMIIWATVNPGSDLGEMVNWCAAFLRDTKEVIQNFAKTGERPDVVEEEEEEAPPPKPVARKPAAKKTVTVVEEDDFDDGESLPF